MEQATPAPEQRALTTELRMVRFALFIGALLMAVKFVAYYATKSSAIFSDAMENIVNVLSSAFAMYSIHVAHRPADAEHPYGHGKVEFLSAGFEGGMILLAAILIVTRALAALALGQGPEQLTLGMLVTGFSALLCALTGLALWRRGRTDGSMTLEADGIHLLSDAITGVVVLIALLVVRLTGLGWLDPLAALGVSIWIGWQAIGLLRRSAAGLMDEQEPADTDLLQSILNSHAGKSGLEPRICSYHKLRHRHSGRLHWVEFHIQVPAHWDVEQGHRVATAIEMEIERALGRCSATAHVEPCQETDCAYCQTNELSTKDTKGHEEI
jgi:cation diffusion facilitator family transporter